MLYAPRLFLCGGFLCFVPGVPQSKTIAAFAIDAYGMRAPSVSPSGTNVTASSSVAAIVPVTVLRPDASGA